MCLKKKLQNKINNNLFKNNKFYLSDTNEILRSKDIKKRLIEFNRNKEIAKIKKKKVLSVIKNGSGLNFWSNFIISFLNNYTIIPIENGKDNFKKIIKFYDYIIIFDNENFRLIYNRNKKNNKIFEKVDYISSTSGSTGESKMILLNFDSIIMNSNHIIKKLNYQKNKNFLIAIPYYFNSAICHFFTCIINEINFVSYERLVFPKNLNEIIKKFEINYFGGAPIQVQWILDFKKIPKKLEKVVSSGDFLNFENINKYLGRYKNKFELFNIYGVTELGGRVFFNNLKKTKSPYTLGKNLNYQKKFLRKISQNIYELGIRSLYSFKGYYGKILQKNVLNKGVFFTNDLIKKDGSKLQLVGRKNEVFKSSGIKVFPELIKKEILKNHEIKNVFVYPYNFEQYGLAPVAAYESKKKIDTNKLIKKLEKKLEKIQIPKKFLWYKKLPLLKNKKINKVKIKQYKF